MNVPVRSLAPPADALSYSAVASDRAMPWLAQALDVQVATAELRRSISLSGDTVTRMEVRSARCIRYKPGRRCLVKYEVESVVKGARRRDVLIGKTRSRGVDARTFELTRSLWEHGFDDNCADRIAVPEPLGIVSKFEMWFSRQCPGVAASTLIGTSKGAAIAARIADVARKIHLASIVPARRHSSDDELQILRARLEDVARAHPRLARRLNALLTSLENLRPRLEGTSVRGIHRDFYPDQLLVNGARTYVLDLDLFSEGDPALDIGNAMAHVTEQALRETGDPRSFDGARKCLLERYLQHAGPACEPAIRTYETLSLARHIAISDAMPPRRHLTEALISLSEQHLAELN